MGIITGEKTPIVLSLPESAEKSFISGQTQNTTDFSHQGGFGHTGYANKFNVSTSRPVDGSETGANWANFFFRSNGSFEESGGVGNNTSGGIVIEDLLPHNKEMEISGYFFRGKTAIEADLGGDSFDSGLDSIDNMRFDIVFESDSTQFSNFTTNGGSGKTRLDYVSPYDGSNQSVNSTSFSKWTYHVGKGVLPAYNGTNVGTKGGWEYSSGRSDNSFVSTVHSDGETTQRDGTLWTVNFDKTGSGLTRFFKLCVVNKSGASVKLKMLQRGNGTSNKHFGVYDLRTKIYDGGVSGREQNGIAYGNSSSLWLATSISGLAGPKVGDQKRFYNLRQNTSATTGGEIPDSHMHESTTALDGQTDSSSTYQIEFPINFTNASTQNWTGALPIASMEDNITVFTSSPIPIGGSPTNDDDGQGTGTHVLGPMPCAGNFKKVSFYHQNETDFREITLSILKVDFGGIEVGDNYSGGSGAQHQLSSAQPENNGVSRNKNWVFSSSNTFNEDESFIMTCTTSGGASGVLGEVAGVLVIEFDFAGLY